MESQPLIRIQVSWHVIFLRKLVLHLGGNLSLIHIYIFIEIDTCFVKLWGWYDANVKPLLAVRKEIRGHTGIDTFSSGLGLILPASATLDGPVSYTHLDVYKRQISSFIIPIQLVFLLFCTLLYCSKNLTSFIELTTTLSLIHIQMCIRDRHIEILSANPQKSHKAESKFHKNKLDYFQLYLNH